MAEQNNETTEIMVNENLEETNGEVIPVLTRVLIYLGGLATPFVVKGAIWLGKKVYKAITGENNEEKPRVK